MLQARTSMGVRTCHDEGIMKSSMGTSLYAVEYLPEINYRKEENSIHPKQFLLLPMVSSGT